eukprot:11592853-Alexandrium_andersonii.AAC.1
MGDARQRTPHPGPDCSPMPWLPLVSSLVETCHLTSAGMLWRQWLMPVSYTHLRAHETSAHL